MEFSSRIGHRTRYQLSGPPSMLASNGARQIKTSKRFLPMGGMTIVSFITVAKPLDPRKLTKAHSPQAPPSTTLRPDTLLVAWPKRSAPANAWPDLYTTHSPCRIVIDTTNVSARLNLQATIRARIRTPAYDRLICCVISSEVPTRPTRESLRLTSV